jgi:hypothetical protein
MPRLPQTIDFNDHDFPELADIFRGIDLGIAAIVASDPAMRSKPVQKRRPRSARPETTVTRTRSSQRKAA